MAGEHFPQIHGDHDSHRLVLFPGGMLVLQFHHSFCHQSAEQNRHGNIMLAGGIQQCFRGKSSLEDPDSVDRRNIPGKLIGIAAGNLQRCAGLIMQIRIGGFLGHRLLLGIWQSAIVGDENLCLYAQVFRCQCRDGGNGAKAVC